MTDREMVIRAMECCAVGAECDHCPYSPMNKSGYEGCYKMHADALGHYYTTRERAIEAWNDRVDAGEWRIGPWKTLNVQATE